MGECRREASFGHRGARAAVCEEGLAMRETETGSTNRMCQMEARQLLCCHW